MPETITTTEYLELLESDLTLTALQAAATADGYWTADRLAIWAAMGPDRRDYDRYQGWFPPGQGVCETADGQRAIDQRTEEADEAEHECRCHINPPCWHCSECVECAEKEN